MMKLMTGVVAFASLLVMLGCQSSTSTKPPVGTVESVSYVTTDELSAEVAEEDGIVLVEFCVPTGCARCDRMRRQIDQLASDEQQGFKIRRVNLQQQPGLAWELGVKMCPSYIAFRDGEEVFRTEYPTSSDLIAVEIARIHQSAEQQPSTQALQLSNQTVSQETAFP